MGNRKYIFLSISQLSPSSTSYVKLVVSVVESGEKWKKRKEKGKDGKNSNFLFGEFMPLALGKTLGKTKKNLGKSGNSTVEDVFYLRNFFSEFFGMGKGVTDFFNGMNYCCMVSSSMNLSNFHKSHI